MRFETLNVLKCQHHVCFNDGPKSCLSDSSDDRQSIKGHHPKYNSYTDLLSVLMLLCCVVNCSPIHHLSHIKLFQISKNVLRNQSCIELTLRVYIFNFYYTPENCKLGADMVHSVYVYNVVYFLTV